jgi:anti-sigma B factor antagonist
MNTELREQILVVEITGRLDASNSKELKSKIPVLLNQSHFIVMDLSGMDFLDSTGLGSIISLLKTASEKKGDVYLAGLQAKPRLLFEITRAYKIFDVFDNLEIAIAEMKTQFFS